LITKLDHKTPTTKLRPIRELDILPEQPWFEDLKQWTFRRTTSKDEAFEAIPEWIAFTLRYGHHPAMHDAGVRGLFAGGEHLAVALVGSRNSLRAQPAQVIVSIRKSYTCLRYRTPRSLNGCEKPILTCLDATKPSNLVTESAGINRHIVGDVKALRKRRSDSILASSLACDPARGHSEA